MSRVVAAQISIQRYFPCESCFDDLFLLQHIREGMIAIERAMASKVGIGVSTFMGV